MSEDKVVFQAELTAVSKEALAADFTVPSSRHQTTPPPLDFSLNGTFHYVSPPLAAPAVVLHPPPFAPLSKGQRHCWAFALRAAHFGCAS